MKKKKIIAWIAVGMVILILAVLLRSSFATKHMAPDDMNQDTGNYQVAEKSEPFFQSENRFIYSPAENLFIPKQFSVEIEHEDSGIFFDPNKLDSKQIYRL